MCKSSRTKISNNLPLFDELMMKKKKLTTEISIDSSVYYSMLRQNHRQRRKCMKMSKDICFIGFRLFIFFVGHESRFLLRLERKSQRRIRHVCDTNTAVMHGCQMVVIPTFQFHINLQINIKHVFCTKICMTSAGAAAAAATAHKQ